MITQGFRVFPDQTNAYATLSMLRMYDDSGWRYEAEPLDMNNQNAGGWRIRILDDMSDEFIGYVGRTH